MINADSPVNANVRVQPPTLNIALVLAVLVPKKPKRRVVAIVRFPITITWSVARVMVRLTLLSLASVKCVQTHLLDDDKPRSRSVGGPAFVVRVDFIAANLHCAPKNGFRLLADFLVT